MTAITWIWICDEHYKQRCEIIGYEIPVLLVYNAWAESCQVLFCENQAEHAIDLLSMFPPIKVK